MDLPDRGECQLVCEPGQKTFITWFGATVNVVTADLAPDKTYDLLIYDDFSKGILFVPLSQAPAKLRDLDKREGKRAEEVYTLERDDVALNFEASQKAHIEKIKADFLGGKKSNRVVHVNKDDCH
jgi:hypothetical protein